MANATTKHNTKVKTEVKVPSTFNNLRQKLDDQSKRERIEQTRK